MDMSAVLPNDCISKIISFTTPKDACRSSLVSRALKEAADSDAVWETFLPSDSRQIVAQSRSPDLSSRSPKKLYLHLSHHPLLLPNGNMTFSLERQSGKKCYTVGARGLCIIWGEGQTPQYWEYVSTPKSRFPEVAELRIVWWLEVSGRLGTKILSPRTAYAVFFIFKFGKGTYGFRNKYVHLSVHCEGSINRSHKSMILNPPGNGVRKRDDGWMEVEMGDFFNENEDDVVVEYKLWETESGHAKKGLVIEGVEFRPKIYE